MLDPVRPDDMLGGEVQHLGAKRGVSAGIGDDPDGMSQQSSVPIAARAHRNFHRMSFQTGPDRLGAGVMHLHRPSRAKRKQRPVRLDIQFVFAAKRTADRAGNDANPFLRQIQDTRKLHAVLQSVLGG
ncbi:hypothetical protein D3C76_1172010 [compost metagenome]